MAVISRVVYSLLIVLCLRAHASVGYSPPSPETGEFHAAEWQDRQEGHTRHMYSLSDAITTPSREWLLFTVYHYFDSPDRPEGRSSIAALGAYHVASKRVLQLVPSPFPGSTIPTLATGDAALFTLGGNCYGVVVQNQLCRVGDTAAPSSQEMPLRGKNARRVRALNRGACTRDMNDSECSLWEWDLDHNRVRLVGPWDLAMTRLGSAVDFTRCDVSWTRSARDPWQGELAVRNRLACTRATVNLRTSARVSFDEMQTYAPTLDPCAFAVCDAWELDSLSVFCVDANRLCGIRWKWCKRDLEAAVGFTITGAAFLTNASSLRGGALPLAIEVIQDGRFTVRVVIMDADSGKIVRQHGVRGYEGPMVSLPIISPDSRYLVFSRTKDVVDEVLCVVDLETDAIRETAKLSDRMNICVSVSAFLSDTQAILSDTEAIWTLDIAADLRLREVFRLKTR